MTMIGVFGHPTDYHRREGLGPRVSRGVLGATFLAFFFSSGTSTAQSTLYVDISATGANDGSSWCDAFLHVQDSLTAARASGGQVIEIRVANGLYRPDRGGGITLGDRTATFELIDGVALRGGYEGCSATDPDTRRFRRYVTTLSGDLLDNDEATQFPGGASFADNSYHVVTSSGAGDSLLEGFTITAGHAGGVSPHDNGGALYIEFGRPTLRRSFLIGNSASRGAAIHNNGGTVSLVDCLLAGNAASRWGGAIDNFNATATLVNCVLVGDTATGEGGAIHSDFSTLTLTNSTLVQNDAGNRGGGVFNYAGVLAVLTNDIVWGNRDSSGGGEQAQIFNNLSNAVEVNHTCLAGWTGSFGGIGNFADDPLFQRDPSPGPDGLWNGVGDDYGDLRLRVGSRSVDAGDNDADTDASASGVQPLPAFDYDSNKRIANRIVDLGAFEHQVVEAPPPPRIPVLSPVGISLLLILMVVIRALLVARRRNERSSP
jgi:hypothetical protein